MDADGLPTEYKEGHGLFTTKHTKWKRKFNREEREACTNVGRKVFNH
jgi:hypothetical protein